MKNKNNLLEFLLVLAFAPNTWAYDLPPLNLGFTTFLDAAPPAGPGLYFQQYYQYYNINSFKDKHGDTIPLPGVDADVNITLSQLIYMDEHAIFGAHPGVDLLLPGVAPHTGYSAPGPFPKAGSGGLGDFLVGPFLQWDPVMGENGPVFAQRVELQIILPTGKYDRNREINPGSNFVSISPYWSGTYFFTPKLTASIRAHYLWNSKNDDPNRGFQALGATYTQAGQAYHMNFAAEYQVIPPLRLGFNGYWLQQVTDTKMDGIAIKGRREQVLGLGVGAMYSFSQDNHLLFNFYQETLVENRTEGQRFNFRWVHHF